MSRLYVVVNVENSTPNQYTYYVQEAETAERALEIVCTENNIKPMDDEAYGASCIGYVAQDSGPFEWGKAPLA